jgi:hypothetical protein
VIIKASGPSWRQEAACRASAVPYEDIDQGIGIKEGDHQLRASDSSASISALVRPVVDGVCCKSHSRDEISGTGAWLARRASSMAAMPERST